MKNISIAKEEEKFMVRLSEISAVKERDPLDILFKKNISITSSINNAFFDIYDDINSIPTNSDVKRIILDPNMIFFSKFIE